MAVVNTTNRNTLLSYFLILRNAIAISTPFILLTIFLSFTGLSSGSFAFFPYVIALVSVLLILAKMQKWFFLFLMYGAIGVILALIDLLIAKSLPQISSLILILIIVVAIYFIEAMFFIFLFYTLKILKRIVGATYLAIATISAFLAYYFPDYTTALVQNIYGLEQILLISTTISFFGLPVFQKLRKPVSNKLSIQLFTAVMVFLVSVLLVAFYFSFTQIQTKNSPILIDLNPLNYIVSNHILSIPLNISALVNSVVIFLFIVGIFGIFVVIRKLLFIVRDLSKGTYLKDLEITEDHFKELEKCIKQLTFNMHERLSYIYFDPVYPLPASANLKGLLQLNNPWWSNLEEIVFSGVSQDMLKDASYHFSKNLNEISEKLVNDLYAFIPKRIEAYCILYDILKEKYDPSLLQILYSYVIRDAYRIKYSLDIINNAVELKTKYYEALKSLDELKEVELYRTNNAEFNSLVERLKEIENILL